MKIIKYTSYLLLTLLITILYIAFGQTTTVFASCSTPSLYVHNTFDNFTYEPNSGVVTNDNPPPNQDSQFYVTTNSSGCLIAPIYEYIIRYWTGSYWQTLEDKYWLSANNTFLSMGAGIRQYLVGVWAFDVEESRKTPERYYYFYSMNKTSSSSDITPISAKLTWSLRMNYYVGIACSDVNCTTHEKYYVLVGKDPAILSNRTASGEIGPIDQSWQENYDSVNYRITTVVNKYQVTSLDPSSTYYWRVRVYHPNGTNTYFSGGSFTTPALPAILPPSDQYTRVFVSSTAYSGNLGGLAGADSKCQARANALSLGGTWKAWLADGTNSPVSRFVKSSVPYKLLDGSLIANDWPDITDGSIAHKVNLTESATDVSSDNYDVWTGTSTDGTKLFTTTGGDDRPCKDWTTSVDNSTRYNNGSAGSKSYTNSYWNFINAINYWNQCDQPHQLYCFEQPVNSIYIPVSTPTPTATPTPNPLWNQKTTTTQPSARYGHTMVYDSVDNKVVLFGGYRGSSGGYLADTWVFDPNTNTWTQKITTTRVFDPNTNTYKEQATTTSPSARYGHTMVYDPVNNKVVLFGGKSPGVTNDTWVYDTAANTWTQKITTTQPSARAEHAMVYDAVNKKVVLFGGYATNNDTWVYDTAANTWTQKITTTQPSKRYGHAMAYDAVNNKVVLFGGSLGSYSSLNDTWVYDTAANTWTQQTTTTQPRSRNYHTMAYDAVNKKVVLFGGIDSGGGAILFDTWVYDTVSNTWTQQTSLTQPPARYFHSMAFDSTRNNVVLFGGYAGAFGGGYYSDTWVYADTFSPLPPNQNPAPITNITDSFNRVDNALSLGNTDTGQTWTLSNSTNGKFGITSNQAYPVDGCPAPGYAVVESGNSNGTVQVTLSTNPQDTRIPFRFIDANNTYFIERRGGTPSYYDINKMVGGVRSTLATTTNSPANGDTISIIFNGSSISLYVNKVLSASADDNSLSGTKHGIGTWCTGDTRFDNFSYSASTTPPSSISFLDPIPCGYSPARATGLVSTPSLPPPFNFGTTGACIIDPRASFIDFEIPSFDELKSLYFDQKK